MFSAFLKFQLKTLEKHYNKLIKELDSQHTAAIPWHVIRAFDHSAFAADEIRGVEDLFTTATSLLREQISDLAATTGLASIVEVRLYFVIITLVATSVVAVRKRSSE